MKKFKELEASNSFLESGMFEGMYYGTPMPSWKPPHIEGDQENYKTLPPSNFNSHGAMLNSVALDPLPTNWDFVYTEDGQKFFVE